MTDYKERERVPKHRSLYFGLFAHLIRGFVLAIIIWLVIMLVSYYFIGVYFSAPGRRAERREEYLDSLQRYVISREIDRENSQNIAEWIRDNPYVFLIVYYDTETEGKADSSQPDVNNKPDEFIGSRIAEALERSQLVMDATSRGYHQITLVDEGTVTVALAEYTENLYYSSFNIISILMAILFFTLSLVDYIRIIIDRIKRFESDVTIVSEIDMDYEIISEGADEIATLSGKVEQMRRSMLDHVKSEQEARETNAELIASISHDIRTPLTVLMGYIDMMKEHGGYDEVMESYILATENTALRLKQLSDDMFKYSLAFGDAEKNVKLEKYDAETLFDQMLSEHFLLMTEMGYDIRRERIGEGIKPGSVLLTDAPNLMRIIDNVFSNLRKYADITKPIFFTFEVKGGLMHLECKNSIRTEVSNAESNGIGLKTCVRLGSLVADKFEYFREGEYFITRLSIAIRQADQ